MSAELAKYVIVITTCPDDQRATQLAAALVERRLAACVQASSISSTYRWQGVVETANEVRLLIKAKYTDYDAIEAFIRSTHSYENPEVLVIPVIAGSQSYLEWIEAETQS
jgi:periplasmic divalent cation tolerance protein